MLVGMQPRLEFPDHAELTPEILADVGGGERCVSHDREVHAAAGDSAEPAGAGEAGGGAAALFNCEDILRAKRSGQITWCRSDRLLSGDDFDSIRLKGTW